MKMDKEIIEIIDKMKRYEDLKIEVKKMTEEIDLLKEEIQPYIPEDKEVQSDRGYFYIQKRPTWKYSPEVDEKEKDLKKLKAHEQAAGIAEVTMVPTLYYKEGAPDEESEA